MLLVDEHQEPAIVNGNEMAIYVEKFLRRGTQRKGGHEKNKLKDKFYILAVFFAGERSCLRINDDVCSNFRNPKRLGRA